VIERAVKGAGIMVSLISRSYLASDYCAQELAWFTEKAAGEPQGLTVDDHVRVFPVLLYNVPPSEWPESCQRTSGFAFHDAVDQEFGKPLDPASGETVWTSDPLENRFSTPTPFRLGEEDLLAVFSEAELCLVDPRNGERRTPGVEAHRMIFSRSLPIRSQSCGVLNRPA